MAGQSGSACDASSSGTSAVESDLPEAAGLTVKIAKGKPAPLPPETLVLGGNHGQNSNDDTVAREQLDGVASDADRPEACALSARSPDSGAAPRRELLHSKSAKAVLTIGAFAVEPSGSNASSPKNSGSNVQPAAAPPPTAAADARPSSTSPPLPVPPVAPHLSHSASSGDYSGVPYHHSPRTSGPGQRPPRTSSTYTPFMVKAPRHANMDNLNQPPSPLMGSPVGTPTAMMFPQTPFAQHHPHFASPYGSGRYPPNPFAPDHPISPQTSGPYGYFHPFFNNIQPFSPSMLNQHGSSNLMHMGGQLSRSNSIVAGQFGKPPPPPGGQPPSARSGRKSASSSGADHTFSRLSESSGAGPPTGGGMYGSSISSSGAPPHPNGPHAGGGRSATSASGAPPPSGHQDGGADAGSGGGGGMMMAQGGGHMGYAPHPQMSQPAQQGMQYVPNPRGLHQHRGPGVGPLWSTMEGDEEGAGAGQGGEDASSAAVPMGTMAGGFAFQPQESMAMYPWMSMPVAGMGNLQHAQLSMAPVTMHPYYMLMMASQQHQQHQQHPSPGAAGHMAAMAMSGMGMGMSSGLHPPPPPPKGGFAAQGPGMGAESMGASSAGGFEFPDLSATAGLPMMGGHATQLSMGGAGAVPQMYGSIPIDLRTGRVFMPPPPPPGAMTGPTSGQAGRQVMMSGGGGGMASGVGPSGMFGGAAQTAAASLAGIPSRAPRRRNATELKVGPDGMPRLNARQRRTLKRAMERALKGLREAGHPLLQTQGVPGAGGGDSSGGDSGAESSGEGSDEGALSKHLDGTGDGSGLSPGQGDGGELFPGSGSASDTTELYLRAAISVASGSAGPKAAAAAAEALSKTAADLEDMDISHLVSHLKEGAVDEKLIRDLQIIQNLIGTLKLGATAPQQASGGQPGSHRVSQSGGSTGGSSSGGGGFPAAPATAGTTRAQRNLPNLQVQVGSIPSPGGKTSSVRASPVPSPGPAAPLMAAQGQEIGGAPKPQTVAAAAAAIRMLPPELQGLGQQMKAIMDGKQGVQAVAAGKLEVNSMHKAGGAPEAAAGAQDASAATARILASLSPVMTMAAAAAGGAGVLMKEGGVQKGGALTGGDGGSEGDMARIAAVH